ncbi:hypothetical protein BJX70DRAFT_403230 [Aspergillus crustosus]
MSCWRDPTVVPPSSGLHTHTIILLHDWNSTGQILSRQLLEETNIRTRLPTVKFVFPTAPIRPLSGYRGVCEEDWFDAARFANSNIQLDLQRMGLQTTRRDLWNLIDEEAAIAVDANANANANATTGVPGGRYTACNGYRRVIVGGEGQGCAAAIAAVLAGNPGNSEARLGAFISLSGWLPFDDQMYDLLNGPTEDTRSMVEILRSDMLGLLGRKTGTSQETGPAAVYTSQYPTPMFIGHESTGWKEHLDRVERMEILLKYAFPANVTAKAYGRSGAYGWTTSSGGPSKIDCVVDFLKDKVGIETWPRVMRMEEREFQDLSNKMDLFSFDRS